MESSRYGLRSRAARPLSGRNLVYHGSTVHGGRFSASRTRSSRLFDSSSHAGSEAGSTVNSAGNAPTSLSAQAPPQAVSGLTTPSPELYKPLSVPPRRTSSSFAPASSRDAVISNLKKELAAVELGMQECRTVIESAAARPSTTAPSPVRALEFPSDLGLVSSSRPVYRTISLKEAQVESICKLHPGCAEKQLNWHFEAESQLQALNLKQVSVSGVLSVSDSHPCGPLAARDLHRYCIGMIKHDASLLGHARVSFPDPVAGPQLYQHLCTLYVASSDSLELGAEQRIADFQFASLGDHDATKESAIKLLTSFFDSVSKLPKGRRADLAYWIEWIVLRLPEALESQVNKLFGDLSRDPMALSSTAAFMVRIGEAVDQLKARRALLPGPKAFATRFQQPSGPTSTRCPAGCDLKFCPKLRDGSASCDIFELTPQRAKEILDLDNNYKKAVHAVRMKNKLSSLSSLVDSGSSPSPSPSPAPAASPAPAPAPSRDRVMMARVEELTDKLECGSCDDSSPPAPKLY